MARAQAVRLHWIRAGTITFMAGLRRDWLSHHSLLMNCSLGQFDPQITGESCQVDFIIGLIWNNDA